MALYLPSQIQKYKQITRNIKECDTAGKDTLLVYGQYMPKLVAAVEALYRRGSFTAMPRGPLGRYVELEDDKWKMAVENVIGNLIFAFAVNDAKDRNVLMQLIKRDFPAHARHTIITSRFTNHVYDVQSGAVRPPIHTRLLMDVLRVTDPVVMNCLIDNCRVETILLTDNDMVAMRLTSHEENVPRRLNRIVLTKPFSLFYPAPNYRSYSLHMRHAQYLQVNMSQRKEILQEELKHFKQTLTDLEQTIFNQKKRVDQNNRTLSEKQQQRAKLQNTLDTIRNDVLELESIEYPSENETEILRKELVELQTSLEENTVVVNLEKERYETHTTLMAVRNEELTNLKEIVKAKDEQIQALQDKFDHGKRVLDEDLVNVKFSEQKIRTIQIEIVEAKKVLNNCKTKQIELTNTAADLGERIERRHNHQQIAAKLRKGEARIANAASSGETMEQLQHSLEMQDKRFKDTSTLVITLKDTLQKLHAAREIRYERIAQLKTHMSLLIQSKFNNLLKLRGYSGELKIDHDNHTLDLSVVPRDKNVKNAVSNAKSLSGGERSYTTIAFLLSLWSCVDFPFYFLDEYDVFTDVVNRHYITKLLFSEADKRKYRQYTFLTPQDMSNVEASDKLSIHRLADPER